MIDEQITKRVVEEYLRFRAEMLNERPEYREEQLILLAFLNGVSFGQGMFNEKIEAALKLKGNT